jgi:hypothetical protein
MEWDERTLPAIAHEARIRFHVRHGAVEAGPCWAAGPWAGSLMPREFDDGCEDAVGGHVKSLAG